MLKPEWIPSAYQDAGKKPEADAAPANQTETQPIKHTLVTRRLPFARFSLAKKR